MFRIEALMNTVLQKTEEVSIACFMDISDRRFKDLAGFMTEFPRLFSVPNDFVPQYILHKFTTKNKVINAISEKEEISTVFSMNEGKFGIKKF